MNTQGEQTKRGEDEEVAVAVTLTEIQVILDALKAWKGRHISSDMLGVMLGGLLKDPEAKSEYEVKEKERQRLQEMEQRQDEETAALLTAKLMVARRTALRDR